MVIKDSRWVVLADAVQRGDRGAVMMMQPEWFDDLSYLTYEAIIGLPTLSLPLVVEALKPNLADVALESVVHNLSQSIEDEDVDTHLSALAYRYGTHRIAEIIESAQYRITQGENRFQISEDVQSELATIHMGAKDETFDDVFSEAISYDRSGYLTGIEQFQRLGVDQWLGGDIISIGGDTGTYKTTFAIHLCDEALKANPDLHVLYFMKEQPRYQTLHKLLARHAGVGYTNIIKYLNRENPSFIQQVREKTEHNDILRRFHIISQDDFSTPYDVANILRKNANRYGKVMWVLDYLTCLEFGGKAEHFNSYLARGLRVLKNAVLGTRSVGVIINQLVNGWNIGRDNTVQKMFPTRSHIIWSSEIKNLSAYIIMLYHPGTYFPYDRRAIFTSFAKLRHSDGTFRTSFMIEGEQQQFRTPHEREALTIHSIEQEIIKG